MNYGIVGQKAPELHIPYWIGSDGKELDSPITLTTLPKDKNGDFKPTIIYCFQARCPGCHSGGFPTLKHIYENVKEHDIFNFLVIQTVFEGFESNTKDHLVEIQKKFELDIPFGQDQGDDKEFPRSRVMIEYRTGGTPWFIYIDSDGIVQINDFRPESEKIVEFMNKHLVH